MEKNKNLKKESKKDKKNLEEEIEKSPSENKVEKISEELLEKIKQLGEKEGFDLRKFIQQNTSSGGAVLETIADSQSISNMRIFTPQQKISDEEKEETKYSNLIKYQEDNQDKKYQEAPRMESGPEIFSTQRINEATIGRNSQQFQTRNINFVNPESGRIKGASLEQEYIATEKVDEATIGRRKRNSFLPSENKEYRVR